MTLSAPSPSGNRLAVVLKQLKQRTGMSLAQLANATTFSKSSWERYLNGKSLPPRSAVKELCRLAGEPADHPLALLDLARTDRTDRTEDSGLTRGTPGRQSTGTGTETPAGQSTGTQAPASVPAAAPPGAGRSETAASDAGHTRTGHTRTGHTCTGLTGHRRVTVVTALASVCAVVLGTLVLTHLPASARKQPAPSPTPPPATGPLCRHTACQNKDPITMKCAADPLTLAEHETATGAWIQIRYSQECGTSWARMWGAVVDDRVEIRAVGGDGSRRAAQVTSRDEADTYVHTLMSVISPGTSVQACFSPAAGGGKECFETRTDKAVFAP
ncbi:helix-turn-helix domain-containing protein [Streptomyces fagopyri]|uniref:helix-turn-helix domain-containing protein n=1 Tax=Streptomyces fagopyri TaxID=2662397 RepID=UPI003718B3BB